MQKGQCCISGRSLPTWKAMQFLASAEPEQSLPAELTIKEEIFYSALRQVMVLPIVTDHHFKV